ncbi:MAG TPA: capsule assembly Wzi family protein [Bryobacteraceae bacterium]
MPLFAAGLLLLALGSPYVPLDSWIYPALDRLNALGYAPGVESLARPWTRSQCLALTKEAAAISERRPNEEAASLISALKNEFASRSDNVSGARLESIYARFLQIAGPPLADGYHFGQTIINDYGRPYGRGPNAISGFSASATFNRFSAFFRGEYQGASGLPSYSLAQRTFISQIDQNPLQPAVAKSFTNRFDPLEMYLGAQISVFNVTFGKQSLWWGPGEQSAYFFSNNAEPVYMLRASQTSPIVLPSFLRYLGAIRTQVVVGRLTGHSFPPKPFFNAEKITLQLTRDLEIGFTRSAIFGGTDHSLTAGSIAASFFSTVSGQGRDPGDRRGGFDFKWHVPGLTRYLTIYSDSLADDDPNPLDNPPRAAWAPGLYISQFPGLPKLDLRFETYSTWLYAKDHGGGFIYWNNVYHDAYTNNGALLGSWIGRDARAYTASSTYWFSARNKIGATWRQIKSGPNFLPGGGTQTDVSVKAEWLAHRDCQLNAYAQVERYFLPVLGPPQHNFTAALQFTFFPRGWGVSR